jgi:hypothetical protein
MNLDEIWYGCYAIGGCSKLVLFNFLQLVIPTALAPLAIGSYSDVR